MPPPPRSPWPGCFHTRTRWRFPGPARADHVTQNAEAADLALAGDEIIRLNTVAGNLQLKGGIAGAVEALRR